MKKLTRTSWINAGFNILDNEGYTRCSVERVARKLDVTRGSFYHHLMTVKILSVQCFLVGLLNILIKY
ncbi:TetR/AcrR family transcriptional regulator [Providencia rettgeri]